MHEFCFYNDFADWFYNGNDFWRLSLNADAATEKTLNQSVRNSRGIKNEKKYYQVFFVFRVVAGIYVNFGSGSSYQPHPTDRFPISFGTTTCYEGVELTGTLTLITHSTVSNSGHVADKQSFNLSLEGFGATSGVRYIGNQSSQMNRTSDGSDGNPSTSTATTHVNIIGQGSAPNFRVRLLIHSTFNANGGATAFQDQFSVDCN